MSSAKRTSCALLNAYINEWQPVMGSYRLRLFVRKKMGLRKYSEITQLQAKRVLPLVKNEVDRLCDIFKLNQMAHEAVSKIFSQHGIDNNADLYWNLQHRIRPKLCQSMTQQEANEFVEQLLINRNLYEFAFGKEPNPCNQ